MARIITTADLKQTTIDVLTAGIAEFAVSVPVAGATGAAGDKALEVIAADPLDWADFPVVAVNLVSDAEQQSHIGDSLNDELVTSEGQVYAGEGALFAQTVEVKLWTTNANQRDRLGGLVRGILFGGRGTSHNPGLYLTSPGISVPRITGGHDEGVSDTSARNAPHVIYARTYFVSALVDLAIQEPAGPPISDVLVSGDAERLDLIAALEPEGESL